jgi:hypothetical protein
MDLGIEFDASFNPLDNVLGNRDKGYAFMDNIDRREFYNYNFLETGFVSVFR